MLPRLIEFIESLPRPGGGFLSEHGGGQVIVPTFPPGITLAVTITPPEGTYAMIAYREAVSPNIVPRAFSGTIQHSGRHYYTGTLSATVIRDGLDFYMVITTADPLWVSITNESALIQYFEEVYQFALVNSKEDYDLIVAALNNLAHTEGREMQAEGNRLLAAMARGA